MRGVRYVVVVAVVVGLTGLVAPAAVPASTPTPAATTTATTARADGGRLSAVITFDKRWTNPFRSRLHWRVWKHTADGRKLVEHRSWRAGSGFTKSSTNACRRNDGWLPDGRYRPRLHANYWGSLIKGRAIYLGNKRCANGTLRTDLFIHTEQGDRSRQCRDRKGDQVCRWEVPKFNDFRSYGCIKIRPHAMKELFVAWRGLFDLGYDKRVRVRVR